MEISRARKVAGVALNSDSTLTACCGKIYDTLFEMNLEPAREDLVRDEVAIEALIESVRGVWVEECGGDPAEWPWNRGYVLKTFIGYRKKTRIEKDGLSKMLTLLPEVHGVVYFIRNSRGHVKIGWTEQDPNDRLAELQTGESDALILESCLAGSPSLEKSLHYNFSQYRIRRSGEWFYSNPGLEKLITEAKQCQ